jgi:predicted esterase YcpF (UPF0227 family)
MPHTTHLLYLHGFRSSPQSTKAQQLGHRVRTQHPGVHWWCPALPVSPRAAMDLLLDGVADWPREQMVVVGSSLGGFYARVMSHRLGCRSALINPAAHPARDLQRHIGEHPAWHDPQERVHFQAVFIDELREWEATLPPAGAVKDPERQRHWAIVAQGDEVLDWREMQAFCAHTNLQLLSGGDHALSDFEQHMDDLVDFLNLAPRSAPSP